MRRITALTVTSKLATESASRSFSRPTTAPSTTNATYRDLLQRVLRFANALKKHGVKKGDRVAIYMPMSIEGIVAMQACARIGATHSVVFGGFSSKSLNERLVDVGAVALVTSDEQMRGGKALPLKNIADEALAMGGCEAVRSVIVYQRTGGKFAWNADRDLWMHELTQAEPDQCAPGCVGAEHPLFILYTSGSTGKPKGGSTAAAVICCGPRRP